MEPQEQRIYCYCNKDKDCKKKNCLQTVLGIFFLAFSITIALIIGAALSEAILDAISAMIVLAIVLLILVIAVSVFKLCNKRRC